MELLLQNVLWMKIYFIEPLSQNQFKKLEMIDLEFFLSKVVLLVSYH